MSERNGQYTLNIILRLALWRIRVHKGFGVGFLFSKSPSSAEVFLWVGAMNKVRDCTCGPSVASHNDGKGVAWGHRDVRAPTPRGLLITHGHRDKGGLGDQGGDCSYSPGGRTRSHKKRGTARSSGERSFADNDWLLSSASWRTGAVLMDCFI